MIAAWGWLAAEGERRRWLTWPLGVAISAAVVTGIVTAVRPTTIWSHDDPLDLPPMLGLVCGGVALGLGLLALGFERRRRSVMAAMLVAAGLVLIALHPPKLFGPITGSLPRESPTGGAGGS